MLALTPSAFASALCTCRVRRAGNEEVAGRPAGRRQQAAADAVALAVTLALLATWRQFVPGIKLN